MEKKVFLVLITPMILLFLFSISHGCVFDVAELGEGGRGAGGAMTAIADGVIEAFYYNPAGLTQLEGENVAGGALYVYLPGQYKNKNGYNERNRLHPVMPFFGYSTDRYSPLILGLGLYSTLGAGFEFRADKEHGISERMKSQIGVMSFSPTIAFNLHQNLSLGVELNIGYGKAEIRRPTPGGYFKLDGDGFGYGATIGLLYKNLPWSVGMSWRSPMELVLKGRARIGTITDDHKTHLYWPQMLTVGVGYRFRRMTLSLDFKWSDWSHFNHSQFNYDYWPDQPFTRYTKDGYRIRAGMEYMLSPKVAIRCGYIYNPYCISAREISPLTVDLTYHSFSWGIGWKLEKFDLDIGFIYTTTEKREVSRNEFPGEYKYWNFIPGIQASYHW